jgi:hypothetical protein
MSLTVPANTSRLVAETIQTTAKDTDLSIFRDQNGDGVPQDGELVCSAETALAIEHCSVGSPVAGNYQIVVSNFEGSGAATDTVTLVTAAVPSNGGASNLTATVPALVTPQAPFDATLAFNLPAPQRNDRWYSVFTLNSGSGSSVLVYGRTNVDLIVVPYTINIPIVRR